MSTQFPGTGKMIREKKQNPLTNFMDGILMKKHGLKRERSGFFKNGSKLNFTQKSLILAKALLPLKSIKHATTCRTRIGVTLALHPNR